MIIYRIDRIKYAANALYGTGAALNGGRWNVRNTPAVYASESRALTMLEVLVNTRTAALVPNDKVIVSIEIPEDFCLTLSIDELSPYWNAQPSPTEHTKQVFQQYCVHGPHGGLRVPSVVMPEEYNFVLYPLHPNFTEYVKIIETKNLRWDARLI